MEGRFGTAVASYFVLLQWLFYMNMAIFGVWTLFVSIPQFVVEPYLANQSAAVLSCVHTLNSSYLCSHNQQPVAVHLALPSCKSPPHNAAVVPYCTGNQSVKVTTLPLGVKNSSTCPYGSVEYYFCPAYTPSFSSPVDLVTGRGGFNDTILFLGHYVNFTVFNGIHYNRPVAILVCTAVVYGISFVMLIIRYSLCN